MSEQQRSCDAVEFLYNRYIKDDPERVASFQEACRQADIAQRVYDIRHKLHMTREDLAEFSGLTAETIGDLEESDYEGNWDAAVQKINAAFDRWIKEVIIPAARMTPDEYMVQVANA